jgi:hypothetical protein
VEAFIFEILTAPDGVAIAPLLDANGPGSDYGYGIYGYYPCADGAVAIRVGKTNAEQYYYNIPLDGGASSLVEGWSRDRDPNYAGTQHFLYYAIDPDGSKTEMTEEEFNAMEDRHPFIGGAGDSYKSELGLRPLSDFEADAQ